MHVFFLPKLTRTVPHVTVPDGPRPNAERREASLRSSAYAA
jgi:hypothetical protein